MADLVAAVPIGQLGINGLLVAMVGWSAWAILTGRLVPRSVVRDHLDVRDDRIAYLTKALDSERDGHNETRHQVTLLSRSSQTSAHALEEMRREAEGSA